MRELILLSILMQLTACIVVNPSAPAEQVSERQVSAPSSSDEKTEWRPSNLSESIALCKKVQEDDDIPVECKFTYFEGLPVMVVGLPNRTAMSQYSDAIGQYLAGPFCASANSASRKAALLFVMQSENAGNLYSCESDESSGWFDMDTDR